MSRAPAPTRGALRRAIRALPASRDLPGFLQDQLGFLDSRAQGTDPYVRLALGVPTYLLRDPADIEHVLVANAGNYDKTRRLTSRRGRRITGDGLLTRTGARHRRRRRALQPAFHRRAVAALAQEAATRAPGAVGSWPRDVAFDVAAATRELVLQLRLATVFADLGETEMEELTHALAVRRRFLRHVFSAVHPLPEYLPVGLSREYRRALGCVRSSVERRLEDRPPTRPDLLSMVCDARENGRPLRSDEVFREVLTLALTGYETLAELLTWSLHLLSANAGARAQALAEVDRALTGRELAVADVASLPFLGLVVQESLRLFPPTWILVRVGRSADRLPSGLRTHVRTKLYLSQWVMHRDPRFHRDPERFDPTRFAGAWRRTMPRGSYFPFGGGPHVCVGERLARTEAVLVLAALLRRCEPLPRAGQCVVPDPAMTLTPRGGLQLVLAARTRAPA